VNFGVIFTQLVLKATDRQVELIKVTFTQPALGWTVPSSKAGTWLQQRVQNWHKFTQRHYSEPKQLFSSILFPSFPQSSTIHPATGLGVQ